MPDGEGHLTMMVSKVGRDTIVALAGELDLHTASKLRELLTDLIHDVRPSLVIDLADLNFIDSTGLGTFVAALQRVRQAGGTMILRSPTASTRRAIEIAGLDRILPIRE